LFPKRGVDSTSRRIRHWAKQFLHNKALSDHQQGRHVKTRSLIEDEDVRSCCRSWLRDQRNDSITALSFSKWVPDQLHLDAQLPRQVSISERTAARWLNRLNYTFSRYGKGLYADGHERDDVVAYRNAFLERMAARLPFMASFEGDDMTVVRLPDLSNGGKRIVLVTHDESCFDSHDGKKMIWMDQDRKPLRQNGYGRSIMVSGFMCECHGPMKLSEEQQRSHPGVFTETVCIIKPGKNTDGYWTNKDLAEQLEQRALPIFKILHPDCIRLFLFDNSQNHHALPPDALKASALNLKDGGKMSRNNAMAGSRRMASATFRLCSETMAYIRVCVQF
jgi:hypothetical protein